MVDSKDEQPVSQPGSVQPGQTGPVYYWIPPQQQQQQAPPWKPEEVNAFIEKLLPYVDKALDYVKQKSESEHKLTELATSHDWKTNLLAYTFLAIVIGLMSGLTYAGRVSGDALLFLAGTITGYIFSIVSKFRLPVTLTAKKEE